MPLDKLAEEFCEIITKAAAGKPFGTTSHAHGKDAFEHLPWSSFFKFSTVFLPQAYWRDWKGRVISPGKPKENYRIALDRWTMTGAPRDKMEPMSGELTHVTAAEIAAYAEEASSQGISRLHFYTATPTVEDSVWKAIAAAGQ